MHKNFLLLKDAVQHPDIPYGDERQVRNKLHASRPIIDSTGTVRDPGDPEFLACFTRVGTSKKDKLLVNVPRLVALLDSRRLDRQEKTASPSLTNAA